MNNSPCLSSTLFVSTQYNLFFTPKGFKEQKVFNSVLKLPVAKESIPTNETTSLVQTGL